MASQNDAILSALVDRALEAEFFFVETTINSYAICFHCKKPCQKREYRVATLTPRSQDGKVGQPVVDTYIVDTYHLTCFENVVDFSNPKIRAEYAQRVRCTTIATMEKRFRGILPLGTERFVCVDNGAERLVEKWLEKMLFLNASLRESPSLDDEWDLVAEYMPDQLEKKEWAVLREFIPRTFEDMKTANSLSSMLEKWRSAHTRVTRIAGKDDLSGAQVLVVPGDICEDDVEWVEELGDEVFDIIKDLACARTKSPGVEIGDIDGLTVL